MFQDIASILAIAAATWAGWEAYRANRRLEEESKPVFRTDIFTEKSDESQTIRLGIQNQEKNSIFVEELQPLNFDRIIPQSGSKVNEVGFWITLFGEPSKTYKMPGEEIENGKWRDFHFKVPRDLRRIKLKIHYSVMTSIGLQKTSCIYDYLIPSHYINDSSLPQG